MPGSRQRGQIWSMAACCVCMCVCMFGCICVRLLVCVGVCMSHIYVCVCVYIYVYVCVCCVCVCLSIWVRVCVLLCVCVCALHARGITSRKRWSDTKSTGPTSTTSFLKDRMVAPDTAPVCTRLCEFVHTCMCTYACVFIIHTCCCMCLRL